MVDYCKDIEKFTKVIFPYHIINNSAIKQTWYEDYDFYTIMNGQNVIAMKDNIMYLLSNDENVEKKEQRVCCNFNDAMDIVLYMCDVANLHSLCVI